MSGCDNRLNFSAMRGDTLRKTIKFSVDGVYQDVDDWTFAGQVRAAPGGSVLATFTIEILTPTTSGISVSLSDTDTRNLPSGVLWYDIQATTPVGDVVTFVRGRLTLSEDITRL